MSRARCYVAYGDAGGNKLNGTAVDVFDPGTTTPITETIYDAFSGGGALANPLTTDANGAVLFYLAAPKRVDLRFRKAGYADFTLANAQVSADAGDVLLLSGGGVLQAGAVIDMNAMDKDGFKVPAAAGAAPTADGALAYDSTAKRFVFGNGSATKQLLIPPEAWTGFTPTLTQGGAVTVTVTYAKYAVIGKVAHYVVSLAVTSAGTGGAAIIVGGWPAAIAPAGAGATCIVGSCAVIDANVDIYHGYAIGATSSTIKFLLDVADYIGAAPSFALASGDRVQLWGSYEIA